ncbi:MAG TPA: VOC family protein [Candidatus Limnocylindrales bacterium]|nr:VOC family protein [Candidatus Limnocylindrales bacterium]
MLADRRVHTTLPAPDVDALRPFYEETLGLTPLAVRPAAVVYRVGDGSIFVLSRSGAKPGGHTQMAFTVPDLEVQVAELRSRGVVFEEYETPKTVDGIATLPAGRAAWFKDPAGNLLGLFAWNDPV